MSELPEANGMHMETNEASSDTECNWPCLLCIFLRGAPCKMISSYCASTKTSLWDQAPLSVFAVCTNICCRIRIGIVMLHELLTSVEAMKRPDGFPPHDSTWHRWHATSCMACPSSARKIHITMMLRGPRLHGSFCKNGSASPSS